MNGFTAEAFEADATSDTTAKENGHDTTGNTATGNSAGNTTAGNSAGSTAANNDWPTLGAAAYHGLAGEVVTALSPQTEADPVALLLQYLAYFGNAVGRGPHYIVENDQHFPNLFVLLAGETAKARKGLSAGRIRHIFDTADPDWTRECITGGMSSGEGILHAIRDPVYTMKDGVSVMADPGIEDKRLLLDEREFYSALEVMRREGNIVSRIVRDAWDCRPTLRTLTKNTHTRVTNAFISIVGHITIEELRQKLDHTSMANGYANRFIYGCVRRSKMLPFGGDALDAADLGTRTRTAIETARNVDRVNMTSAAMELWVAVYPQLSGEVVGLLGSLTARAEGQTIRLSLIYALLDGIGGIDRAHLEAALAVWAFCNASARLIFGDVTGDTIADAILRALRSAGATGKTRTEIYTLFNSNRRSGDIGRALELLMQRGKARTVTTPPPPGRRGRPTETWYAI